MSKFSFEDILGLQNVLDANLWQCAELPNSKSDCPDQSGPRRIGWEVRYENHPFEGNPSSLVEALFVHNKGRTSVLHVNSSYFVLDLATDDHCPHYTHPSTLCNWIRSTDRCLVTLDPSKYCNRV